MAETKTSDICEYRLRTPDSIAPRKNTGDRKYQCAGKKQTLSMHVCSTFDISQIDISQSVARTWDLISLSACAE